MIGRVVKKGDELCAETFAGPTGGTVAKQTFTADTDYEVALTTDPPEGSLENESYIGASGKCPVTYNPNTGEFKVCTLVAGDIVGNIPATKLELVCCTTGAYIPTLVNLTYGGGKTFSDVAYGGLSLETSYDGNGCSLLYAKKLSAHCSCWSYCSEIAVVACRTSCANRACTAESASTATNATCAFGCTLAQLTTYVRNYTPTSATCATYIMNGTTAVNYSTLISNARNYTPGLATCACRIGVTFKTSGTGCPLLFGDSYSNLCTVYAQTGVNSQILVNPDTCTIIAPYMFPRQGICTVYNYLNICDVTNNSTTRFGITTGGNRWARADKFSGVSFGYASACNASTSVGAEALSDNKSVAIGRSANAYGYQASNVVVGSASRVCSASNNRVCFAVAMGACATVSRSLQVSIGAYAGERRTFSCSCACFNGTAMVGAYATAGTWLGVQFVPYHRLGARTWKVFMEVNANTIHCNFQKAIHCFIRNAFIHMDSNGACNHTYRFFGTFMCCLGDNTNVQTGWRFGGNVCGSALSCPVYINADTPGSGTFCCTDTNNSWFANGWKADMTMFAIG